MTRKRMFSNDIINTDDFIDMPLSSQALYFHLGMSADDEGFVQPKRIMRMVQAKDDDLKVLVSKKFVKYFESGVLVIVDWHVNNYLDKNRIKPTEYQEEKKKLLLTEGNKYELNKCLTNDKQMLTQYRVEESSIEENRINTVHFEEFWNLYPVKKGKKTAEQKWCRLDRETQNLILADIPERKNDDGWKRGYIPHPTTYLNQERWNDEITPYQNAGRKKQITVLSDNSQNLLGN